MTTAVFACVGEDRPDWHIRIHNLVLSVRRSGGSLAAARFVVHLVGGADADFVVLLAALDAEVVVVEPMDPRLPTSNKLRMLELEHDAHVLVMLDCDVVVLGDLGPELDAGQLRATVAGKAHLDDGAWARLYEGFGIDAPTQRIRTAITNEWTHPYWNSGVLFVPKALQAPLLERWEEMIDAVLEVAAGDRKVAAFRKDQIPFALALASLGVEVRELPISLNLPTTQAIRPSARRQGWGPPFVLHYHRSVDGDGFLRSSPDAEVTGLIDDFNRVRAAATGAAAPAPAPMPGVVRWKSWVQARPAYWRVKRRARPLLRRLARRRRRSGAS